MATHPAVHLETDEFNHAFLSTPNVFPAPSTSKKNPFHSLRNANTLAESNISDLLVAAINGNALTQGSTSSRYTPHFDSKIDKTTLPNSTAIFRTVDVPSDGQPQWSDLSVPVEVYTHRRGVDPFDNARSQIDTATERARQRVLDRISTVAEILFAAQHRVFLFMVLIIGRKFRFLRLDRAGIIATPSIDYYEHPHILCNILWRVSQLDDIALGLDPTVTRVLPGDLDFSRMDFLSLRNPFDLDDAEGRIEESGLGGPLVFRVQVRDGKEMRDYLVGKPSFRSGEFLGRGTCGYVAYDCKTHRFVWLKDAWRASYMLAETEGDVLRKLNEAEVSNVPTLVCASDVGDQATITADWWERTQSRPLTPTPPHLSSASCSSSTTLASSASPGSRKRKRVVEIENTTSPSRRSPNATLYSNCPLRQHKRYRIVVEEVCMPLKSFQYGHQLVSIVLDCLVAHYQAATHPQTQLLHCDISGGNVLICPRIRRDKDGNSPVVVWTGVLSDWELSRRVGTQDAASKQTQTDRMGTYQFMSVNLLNHITKPVKVSDEVESFFHLLVYYAIRHLRSNCPDVSSWIEHYFHNYSGPERMLTCGQKSSTVEVTGMLEIDSPEGPLLFYSPMDRVLSVILKSLRAHYKVMEYDAVKTAPSPPRSPETPPPPPSNSPLVIPMRDLDDDDRDDDLDDEQVAKWEARLQACPLDRSPTSGDRELAKTVADHTFMIDHLTSMLRDRRWRANDRISAPLQAPATPSAKPGAPPSEPAPSQSNKRQRMSGPERNVSLPARLRASTRRTRTPRTQPIRARR